MKRFFKLVAKKKGTRSNASRWWGVLGEIVFSSTLLFSGVALLATVTALELQLVFNSQWTLRLSAATQLLVGAVLAGFGAWGIARTAWNEGTTQERRKALLALAQKVELLDERRLVGCQLPTIPNFLSLSRTPGVKFGYQIAAEQRQSLGLLGNLLLTVLFVVVSSVLVLHCLQSLAAGAVDWLACGLAVGQVALTAWQSNYFVRTLFRQSVFGPTRIEVSNSQLAIGNSYPIYFQQHGRLRINLIEIELICVEKTTFNQGTDVRTEIHTVFSDRLLRLRGVDVSPTHPLDAELVLELPAGLMHSFTSPNNRICWSIVVTCTAKSWPVLRREFPLVILPPVESVEAAA